MRGKEKLIPHAARAGRWLEGQSWGLPSFLASSQSEKGLHTTTTTTALPVRISGAYIRVVYRVVYRG